LDKVASGRADGQSADAAIDDANTLDGFSLRSFDGRGRYSIQNNESLSRLCDTGQKNVLQSKQSESGQKLNSS
jgi:hypothetical protein